MQESGYEGYKERGGVGTGVRKTVGIRLYGAAVITGLMRGVTLRGQRTTVLWRLTFICFSCALFACRGSLAHRQHCLPSWSLMHHVHYRSLYVTRTLSYKTQGCSVITGQPVQSLFWWFSTLKCQRERTHINKRRHFFDTLAKKKSHRSFALEIKSICMTGDPLRQLNTRIWGDDTTSMMKGDL